MDVDAVDFGLVSYSYRYTKEFTLKNVCPIPMQYEWRLPKDHQVAAKKEFTVSGPTVFWFTLTSISVLFLHAKQNGSFCDFCMEQHTDHTDVENIAICPRPLHPYNLLIGAVVKMSLLLGLCCAASTAVMLLWLP